MTILQLVEQDNVFYDTKSKLLLNIGEGNYINALMYCDAEDLYTLSEHLGHPVIKICWAFNTYHKEWKPSCAFDINKDGDIDIYNGCYEGVLVEIITERPLWDSRPDSSVLAELEARAYEKEAELNKG